MYDNAASTISLVGHVTSLHVCSKISLIVSTPKDPVMIL